MYLNFLRNFEYETSVEFSACDPLVQDSVRGKSDNNDSNKADRQIILPGQISISYPKNSGDDYGQFDKDVEIALKGELFYRSPYASDRQSEKDGN